jgi:hypothetical protein
MKTEDKPRFLLAAEELARQRGTDAREILRRDREVAQNSGYPGPDCLVPDEIESFFADPVGMEADRAEHAMSCAACSTLLASAGADPVEIERLLEEVRNQPRMPSPVGVKGPHRRPGRISLVAGLGLAAVAATTFIRRRSKGQRSRTSPEPVGAETPMEPIPVRATLD